MANAGAFNLRQIILGTFDQRIHTTGQADTTDIFKQTYMDILGLETVPGTNMPANFGHMVGYDSQYYGYLVSVTVSIIISRYQKHIYANKRLFGSIENCESYNSER